MDFAADVYLSEPRTHTPPLLTHCIRTQVFLFTHGRGEGGELNQREGERGNSSQSWVENSNMTDSISSLKTLINVHVSF